MKLTKEILGARINGEAKYTAECGPCGKVFSADSQSRVDQALRMHAWRAHRSSDKKPTERKTVERKPKGKLSKEEMHQLITYIREHQAEFVSKAACVRAAFDAWGLTDRIKISSTMCDRYFAKAGVKPGAEKRKYVRREPKEVVQSVAINFCPNCGCNIHGIATGMVLASKLK